VVKDCQSSNSLLGSCSKPPVTHCLEAAASRQARILSYLSHVNLNGVCVCGYLFPLPRWVLLNERLQVSHQSEVSWMCTGGYTGMQFLPVSFPTQLLCFYWRNYLPGKASDINILHTNTYEWSLHTNSYECWYIKLSFKVVSLTSQGTNMEKHTYS